MRDLGVAFADFHDADSIPATDCEFLDAYHTGDITYLKMLVKMARRWSWLSPLVNVAEAEHTIANFDGNVIDQSASSRFTGVPETNFLHMNCERRPSL